MGRVIVAAAVALVIGLFIGGLGPRRELDRTRRELDAARAAAARGGSGNALPFALGMGGLLAQGRGGSASGSSGQAPPRFQVPPAHLPAGGSEAPPSEEAEGADGGRRQSGDPFSPDAFAAAKAAAALRAAQFRAAFVEEARLSPQAAGALDSAVADMNRELATAATELGTALSDKPRLGPREMADIGARVLDVYRRADDRFKSGLDDQGKAALEKTDFDLLTQIDLGSVEGLAAQISRMQSSEALRGGQ